MTSNPFQLVILRRDLADLRLGYTYAEAFPKLQTAGTADALFVVGTDQIEGYHWDAQSITLTRDATQGLLAALESPEDLKESVRALNSLREGLGWGDCLDRGLYTKGFLVLVDDEPLYGGIFLDATSQRLIQYPVIRASLGRGGKARFNLLPVHVAFFTQDPVVCGGGDRDEGVARETAGDWRQFPEEVKSVVAGWATTETANGLRKLIRSDSVRAIMESNGKIR